MKEQADKELAQAAWLHRRMKERRDRAEPRQGVRSRFLSPVLCLLRTVPDSLDKALERESQGKLDLS